MILDIFIPDHIDRELHSLKCLDLKFGLKFRIFRIFEKKPVRILLDVLFHVFRFSLCPDIFIHDILKLYRHLDTET